jgi:hypothetical protein
MMNARQVNSYLPTRAAGRRNMPEQYTPPIKCIPEHVALARKAKCG